MVKIISYPMFRDFLSDYFVDVIPQKHGICVLGASIKVRLGAVNSIIRVSNPYGTVDFYYYPDVQKVVFYLQGIGEFTVNVKGFEIETGKEGEVCIKFRILD